jgi:hypothetical protein
VGWKHSRSNADGVTLSIHVIRAYRYLPCAMGEKNMAYCPRCNQSVFEIEAIEIEKVKLNVVQCAGCEAPVEVIDPSLGLTEVLRVLVSSLQKLNSRLEQIERALGK